MNEESHTQIVSEELPVPRGHFSHAVRAGNTVYVSGLLPFDDAGAVVAPGQIGPQADRIFEILARVLRSAGAGCADVVQMTSYVTDIAKRAEVNDARARVFGATRPASTLVEVSALAAPGALIEIDAIAVIPG
ncbi:RidA family protein [Bradyrhizobium iriomotense]|uniref:RidA family protein n=1 Tax=Bradyrhizobium iriomotense TaxID=441950 RepID=UPI001B8A57B7|nr:RidA family protein [Bradyrhizobium iriomotense]MBR0784784.1 RidA family protein [Bradyrhizobium iriomotense]